VYAVILVIIIIFPIIIQFIILDVVDTLATQKHYIILASQLSLKHF